MQNKMSLFDISGLELVKKKYYSADKVNEQLAVIRAAYEQCVRENEELKNQLDAYSAQKGQISDTLMSAQSIAQQIIEDAKTQAEEMTKLAQTQAEESMKAAEMKAELILSGAKSKRDASDKEVNDMQEYALKCVEACVNKLRGQQMEAIEFINSQWQEFLGGLILPEDAEAKPVAEPEAKAEPVQQGTDWMAFASMELPDLEEQYADIDADTFFSGGFFSEQSGTDLFEQLKSMMDSIEGGREK